MVAHARVQAAHGQPPTALASLSVEVHATTSSVTYMQPSDNYQHSNPQARTTSTPKPHFQSRIYAYLTA
ncbi:hypothetical protein DFH27DRAFT_618447 [Peziza echinospora]|nr:hypothetical protein DFH27DRAFT_618447 [Peziza echinospora]